MWRGSAGVFSAARRLLVGSQCTPCTQCPQKQHLPANSQLSQLLTFVRNTNFFNKLPAEHIWKGVTSVSNAGSKKGRGRGVGRKRVKDLNRGQIIGVGKANIVWPGLSSPVVKGDQLIVQQKLPEDPDREAKLTKLRDAMKGFRILNMNPLDRGWSGARMPGRKMGPPDPIGEDQFEGFETICLEFKPLLLMSGTVGRTRKISTMAVTGNGKGLAGFAIGKAREGMASLRISRNRAGQKLMYIELYNNHTVYHDFYTQFGRTKIFVWKKPEGYGLECHRAIKAICQVVGIKDLKTKIEGSKNLQHIVKAFFLGLLKQKTHQQFAEEKKLHLVEFRKENEYFPKVVASPEQVRTEDEIPSTETLDFTQIAFENRVVLERKKWPPFYTNLPHWPFYMKRLEKKRNHYQIKMEYLIEKGKLKSFLNEKYPDDNQPKE